VAFFAAERVLDRRVWQPKRELDVNCGIAIESSPNTEIALPEGEMDKLIQQSLTALLAREGLEPREGDLEQFAKIIELYMENLKQLHSVNLGAEELGPVFRPEWTNK
jgi:hypothetical protein